MFSSSPSTTSAFGSFWFSGQPITSMVPTPSPFSTNSPSPFISTGYTPFSETNASTSSTTGFDFKTAHRTLSAIMTYTSGSQNLFTGNQVKAPIFCSGPNPFATTVEPPSMGQFSFLNHVKANPSVVDKLEEWEKSTQLICKDVQRLQQDIKSRMELEKMEAAQTISQLRKELAHVNRSKGAIIAEYLASPAFTKRLDEEHEKRLSKIFHPTYVKTLGAVQTKLKENDSFSSQRPATPLFSPTNVTPLVHYC